MNKVILMGKISRPPVYAHTLSGVAVFNFDLETVEKWVDKEGKDQTKRTYHKAVQYGKNADISRELFMQGDLVSVEGSLQTTSFENKKGEKEYRTEVKVQLIQPLNNFFQESR